MFPALGAIGGYPRAPFRNDDGERAEQGAIGGAKFLFGYAAYRWGRARRLRVAACYIAIAVLKSPELRRFAGDEEGAI